MLEPFSCVDPVYDSLANNKRILKEFVVSRLCPSKSKVASTLDNHTMMSQHSRRKLPQHGKSRKGNKHAEVNKPAAPKAAEPTSSNRLLAGYLAHEYLTKGTLLGRKFELGSARAGLCGSTSAQSKRSQVNSQSQVAASAVEAKPSAAKEHDSYKEVANLLRTKGTHIKGIVNPTQLSKWINK